MNLLEHRLFILFAIAALGSVLGRLRVAHFSLGSAGVMLVGLIFGHFGLQAPDGVMDLGLLLFVYAVGVQAGPRFFRTFRRSGVQFLALGIVPVVVSLAVTVLAARLLGLSAPLTLGIFSGALTNTSALASAVDAIAKHNGEIVPAISVGYGMVYPLSMFLVVVIVQALPVLLRVNLGAEEDKWLAQRHHDEPPVTTKQFLITNHNVEGKTIRELDLRKRQSVTISRVNRANETFPADPNFALRTGDIVTVVTGSAELSYLELLFGSELEQVIEVGTNMAVQDVELSEASLTGRPLKDLRLFESYKVTITRIRRHRTEFLAHSQFVLDIGDHLRVVGERPAVEQFAATAGARSYLVEEANMAPLLLGLLLGVAVGALRIPLPGGYHMQLGLAGGAFLVSLLMGHYGRIGRVSMYVPQAAKNLCRELGLILFLAGAGSAAGNGLVTVLLSNGGAVLLCGLLSAFTAIAVTVILAHYFFRMNVLSSLGSVCGTMNNSTGLAAIRDLHPSDLPGLSYAGVYPVSLIFKILSAQLLVIYLGLG